MGDPQGDLRPGTPVLVDFFTEMSKKWVLDSKTPLVAPPRHTVQASKKNSPTRQKLAHFWGASFGGFEKVLNKFVSTLFYFCSCFCYSVCFVLHCIVVLWKLRGRCASLLR